MPAPETPAIEAAPAGAEPGPGERAEDDPRRGLREELSEQKREARISAENLDALHADTVIGGDDIGGDSHRAADGGTVNAAGRDLYVIGSGSWQERAVLTVAVPVRAVGLLRRCHVQTASWHRLVGRLWHEHVLVLKGEPHSGAPTTALAALAEWAGDHDRLALLQVRADPFRLIPADLREATGYLYQADDDGAWRRHPEHVLAHLSRAAERSDARIVVLAGPEFAERDWLVDHDPPPPDRVFLERLAHELREGGETDPRERAAAAAADELVRAHLAGNHRPRHARELALQVSAGLLRGRPISEILEALPDRRRRTALELLGRDTPRRRCFLIASAVLRGSPAAVVAAQTVRLATLAEEELARQTTAEQPRRPHRWEWLSEWTEGTGIRIEQPGRDGDGRVVTFDEPRMAGTILRVVWEEQPTIREPLLAWLEELTAGGHPGVRRKAAEAVGLLATFDFPSVEQRFLRPWRDAAPGGPEAAAWALASAARDPRVQPRVLDCLRGWAHGGRGAQSVVIRTYGSWLGAYRLGEALSALGGVARTSGAVLVESVARAVSEIHQLGAGRTFRYGDGGLPENTRRIVAALAEWSADPEGRGRPRAAALAFVRLLASPDGVRVIDAAADAGAAADLVALWRHVLDQGVARPPDPAVTPQAWSLLGDWLTRYEADAGIRRVLAEVLTRPPGHLRTPLAFHLRLWRRTGRIDAGLAARLAGLAEGS